MTPQLAGDLDTASGKGKTGYCEAENISHGHRKNEGVFFSVMSLNVPDKMILVDSSPEEKMELDFISPSNKG
ncbi:hypothetical protein TNCV_3529661 [Trichonephila clavipes]|uniref:Uncharacterized protein n=1 Tax=Trichonephila clavipes TaxID=2585209 RepID=A0A8X6RM44_TRICX|nr:hypothetical protein TNCV_3529661 [Trichonephila clavipes]